MSFFAMVLAVMVGLVLFDITRAALFAMLSLIASGLEAIALRIKRGRR